MNQRVGLIGDNSVAFVKNLLEVWKNQDCAVIVDWRIPWEKAQDMLSESEVIKCYVDRTYAEKFDVNSRQFEVCVYDSKKETEFIPFDVVGLFAAKYSDEEALILFSSGTTGKSKGVILSFYSINTNADAIIKYMELTKDDCIFIAKSLAHSSTIVGELVTGLKKGAKICISPTVSSVSGNLAKIENVNASILCINPTLLHLYSMTQKTKKLKLESLRTIYVSGSILNKSEVEEAEKLFPHTDIFNVYGLTEAGPRVSAQFKGRKYNDMGGVGEPIDKVKVRIVNNDGVEAATNERGNILVSSPSIAIGYVNRNIGLNFAGDNWLKTGDVGYFNEHGELFITGRSDNMIIVGSHNVFPEEIEEFICGMKGIDDCIVLSDKDKVYGERIACFYLTQEDISPSDIRAYCKNKLSSYEIPAAFSKVESIIVNNNGKKVRDIRQYRKEIST